jgi:hypothetical protein
MFPGNCLLGRTVVLASLRPCASRISCHTKGLPMCLLLWRDQLERVQHSLRTLIPGSGAGSYFLPVSGGARLDTSAMSFHRYVLVHSCDPVPLIITMLQYVTGKTCLHGIVALKRYKVQQWPWGTARHGRPAHRRSRARTVARSSPESTHQHLTMALIVAPASQNYSSSCILRLQQVFVASS